MHIYTWNGTDNTFSEASVLKLQLLVSHCIAKIFVTTNPHLISDSMRQDSLDFLLIPLRTADASVSFLMLYECLMALVNLVSVGVAERLLPSNPPPPPHPHPHPSVSRLRPPLRSRSLILHTCPHTPFLRTIGAHFIAARGLQAVYTHVASDNDLVQTAAVEVRGCVSPQPSPSPSPSRFFSPIGVRECLQGIGASRGFSRICHQHENPGHAYRASGAREFERWLGDID